MANKNTTETIGQLHAAALQVAAGFERAAKLDQAEQAEAMREASAALIEMRRTTDSLARELGRVSMPPLPPQAFPVQFKR